jgi:hypothetical protein
MKIDNIKEEVTRDMENLRKKNETDTKHSVSHSNWLEQVEDRISELEDKIEIKGKTEEILSQTTEDLWKKYARTQQLHQKTKPENHGH